MMNGSFDLGSITSADRPAVYEAVADILQHWVFFAFQIYDIYITEQGVRFANASSAKYYQDRDELAEEAEVMWETLTDIFTHVDDGSLKGLLSGSRSIGSSALIVPRLPSPSHPLALTPEEAIIRWVWSITVSDEYVDCPTTHSESCMPCVVLPRVPRLVVTREPKVTAELYFYLMIPWVTWRILPRALNRWINHSLSVGSHGIVLMDAKHLGDCCHPRKISARNTHECHLSLSCSVSCH